MADPKKPKDKAAETPAEAEAPAAASGDAKAAGKEVEEVKAKKPASKAKAKAKGDEAGAKPTATSRAKSRAKAETADKPAAKKPAAKAKAQGKPKAEGKPAAGAKADDKPAAKGKAAEKPAAGAKAEEKPAAGAKAEDKPAPAAKAEDKAAPKAQRPAARTRGSRAERRGAEPAVVVRAHAKYVRSSARKARLVCDAIRGKDVGQARAILAFHPRAVAEAWEKLLDSAVANAENNHDLDGDDLKILAVFADEGPTIKRYRPRAMGRATQIRKRTSHLTIQLTPKETR